MSRCRCGGWGWVGDLTWCGDHDCCPKYLNCLVCNPQAEWRPPPFADPVPDRRY